MMSPAVLNNLSTIQKSVKNASYNQFGYGSVKTDGSVVRPNLAEPPSSAELPNRNEPFGRSLINDILPWPFFSCNIKIEKLVKLGFQQSAILIQSCIIFWQFRCRNFFASWASWCPNCSSLHYLNSGNIRAAAYLRVRRRCLNA